MVIASEKIWSHCQENRKVNTTIMSVYFKLQNNDRYCQYKIQIYQDDYIEAIVV